MMTAGDELVDPAAWRYMRMDGWLPVTCLGCEGRMEDVGCKLIVGSMTRRDAIWVCPTCEPIMRRMMAEEGMELEMEFVADAPPRRDRRADARAVKRAQRGRRPNA